MARTQREQTLARIEQVSLSEGMSSKRLNSLSDYARHGSKLRLDCGCGRVALVDPHTILALCQERGWRYTMEGIAMKFRCSKCGQRPKMIGPALWSGG